MKKYALILAGGMGKRLWPISNSNRPKQFAPLISSNAIIIDTINRIKKCFDEENIFIITNEKQFEQMKEQVNKIIPQKNILIEPVAKGTAACILYSAMNIVEQNGHGLISIFSSDHFIREEEEWNKTISCTVEYAEKNDVIATIGINPTYPNTEYGYIQIENKINEEIYSVKNFTEKPSCEKAREYLEAGNYLWNSGNFIAKTEFLFSIYKKFLPETYNLIINMYENDWAEQIISENYKKLENISIDYGILEKTNEIVVAKTDAFWSDVGTIKALSNVIEKDSRKNVSNRTEVTFVESSNNFVYSETKHVVTFGVDNMVLLECNDLIVLTTKEKIDEIKTLAENDELKKYL